MKVIVMIGMYLLIAIFIKVLIDNSNKIEKFIYYFYLNLLMGLEKLLQNTRTKIKDSINFIRPLLKNPKTYLTLIVGLSSFGLSAIGVSVGGTFHAKQDSTIRGYAPLEIYSNYDSEEDTTDAWGRWTFDLPNTNIGDTVWVDARKDTLGKVYIAHIKDLADGIGAIPEAWMYDSTGTPLKTFNIYVVLDSLNQNGWDTLKPMTKLYLFNKSQQPDSMVVDTAGQKIYNPNNYNDWRWESHLYDVFMPIWTPDSTPIEIQPGDSAILMIYKYSTDKDSVKAFIDTIKYTGKYGDAWVYETPDKLTRPNSAQYTQILLRNATAFIRESSSYYETEDTIPLWTGTTAQWDSLNNSYLYLPMDTIIRQKPNKESNKPKLTKGIKLNNYNNNKQPRYDLLGREVPYNRTLPNGLYFYPLR